MRKKIAYPFHIVLCLMVLLPLAACEQAQEAADSAREAVDGAMEKAEETTVTECKTYEEEGCYWMENYDERSCWIPAEGVTTFDECKALDSCSEGGGGQSGGGCYKWADGSEGDGQIWACEYIQAEQCYWMENYDTHFCWVPAPQGEVDQAGCQALDSCSEGGGGESGGGCYKWAASTAATGASWQ